MTPNELYSAIGLPDRCRLGKRVFKKLFHENAVLTPSDKRALTKDVESVTWEYTLKPSTISIQPYVSDDREYLEIAVLDVRLSGRRSSSRIAEIIHRSIPYPLVIVLSDSDGIAVSVAHKRFSVGAPGTVVAEGFLLTTWLDGDDRSAAELAFVESLRLSSLPQTDFLTLHTALAARVLALICAGISGRFEVRVGSREATRREHLERCRQLEREATAIRNAIRDESRFARQVELNEKLKNLEHRLEQEAAQL